MPLSGDYDFTYPSKLKAIKITLVDTFIGAKNFHLMECDICKHKWTATPLSKLQNFKKHKMYGCPLCTSKQKHKQTREANIAQLQIRFNILSEYDGRVVQDISNEPLNVTVQNKDCGHTFTSSSKNLLTRNVICPVCNKQRKREKFQQYNIDRSEVYMQTAELWDQYRHKVYMATRRTYYKHKDTINPQNLPRGLAGEEGAYQLDHIKSVRWCFENYVPVKDCANKSNLQMLTWEDNLSKHNKTLT